MSTPVTFSIALTAQPTIVSSINAATPDEVFCTVVPASGSSCHLTRPFGIAIGTALAIRAFSSCTFSAKGADSGESAVIVESATSHFLVAAVQSPAAGKRVCQV